MNDREEILDKISYIAGEVLARPDLVLSPEMSARDVPGWDSLNHVQIVIGVERAFGIRLSAMEVAQLDNAGDLADTVLAKRD